MRYEKYPAMPAMAKTPTQLTAFPQYKPQQIVVREYHIPHLSPAVPSPGKLKPLLQFYCKKASLSLMMLMFWSSRLVLAAIPICWTRREHFFKPPPTPVNFSAVLSTTPTFDLHVGKQPSLFLLHVIVGSRRSV
jgi:hypothetical protein